MNELCIPLPVWEEKEVAEVEVTIGGKKHKYHFRVESFPWLRSNDENHLQQSFEQVLSLREAIENYDDGWEIIQIFTPEPGADHIQVLFREKQ